jgi:hypothetical protein
MSGTSYLGGVLEGSLVPPQGPELSGAPAAVGAVGQGGLLGGCCRVGGKAEATVVAAGGLG